MTDQTNDRLQVELTDDEVRVKSKALVAMGFKQSALADAAKIDRSQFSRFLSGGKNLGADRRGRLIAVVQEALAQFGNRPASNACAPPKDYIDVDALIAMKLKADFDKSAISTPGQLVLGKQRFVERSDIITKYPEFALAKSVGGLQGYDRFLNELDGLILANRKAAEWPNDVARQQIMVLKQYNKVHGPLRANCNIQLAPLATMYALRNYCGIDIDVDVRHASGVEMIHDLAKQMDTRPYDFIACTTGAFNLTLVGQYHITTYQPVVALCYEDHEFLYDAKRLGETTPELRVIVTYGYSASDENAMVSQHTGELRQIEVQQEDKISTLVRMFSRLEDGMAINLWAPLTVVLRKRFGWARAALPPYPSQIVLYQHERFSLRSLLPVSDAFRRLYVQQWNWLRIHRGEALSQFWGNKELKYQFWRGAGLDVLTGFTS